MCLGCLDLKWSQVKPPWMIRWSHHTWTRYPLTVVHDVDFTLTGGRIPKNGLKQSNVTVSLNRTHPTWYDRQTLGLERKKTPIGFQTESENGSINFARGTGTPRTLKSQESTLNNREGVAPAISRLGRTRSFQVVLADSSVFLDRDVLGHGHLRTGSY